MNIVFSDIVKAREKSFLLSKYWHLFTFLDRIISKISKCSTLEMARTSPCIYKPRYLFTFVSFAIQGEVAKKHIEFFVVQVSCVSRKWTLQPLSHNKTGTVHKLRKIVMNAIKRISRCLLVSFQFITVNRRCNSSKIWWDCYRPVQSNKTTR